MMAWVRGGCACGLEGLVAQSSKTRLVPKKQAPHLAAPQNRRGLVGNNEHPGPPRYSSENLGGSNQTSVTCQASWWS